MALDTGPIPTENQFSWQALVACLARTSVFPVGKRPAIWRRLCLTCFRKHPALSPQSACLHPATPLFQAGGGEEKTPRAPDCASPVLEMHPTPRQLQDADGVATAANERPVSQPRLGWEGPGDDQAQVPDGQEEPESLEEVSALAMTYMQVRKEVWAPVDSPSSLLIVPLGIKPGGGG